MFFNKNRGIRPKNPKKPKKPMEIKSSDKMEGLQECMKACDILKLPFTITKRNVGGEDNPLYFYFFYINFKD